MLTLSKPYKWKKSDPDLEHDDAFIQSLAKRGYDSIVGVPSNVSGHLNDIVVFSPKQIKVVKRETSVVKFPELS